MESKEIKMEKLKEQYKFSLWEKLLGYVLLFFLACLLLSSCNNNKTETAQPEQVCAVKHPNWSRNAVIYEVNLRQYTQEGTIEAFEAHLPRLKELGVDILWFMPVHPISEKNRKGTLGSYYAVRNYLEINPEFGTLDEFKSMVENAHNMGFKVILDWVANHTGCDNVWTAEHPEWYVRDSTGNFVSPYDWSDVYKLDYSNADMRRAMTEALKFWIRECDIDGYRCDVAYEVPTDFWINARKELDAIKPVFMLAESETADLLQEAFDMDYSWELMHLMNAVAKREKNVADIYTYLHKLDTTICNDAYKMNLITNHDENSWNGTEYERLGDGVNAFAVMTYTLPGMPLIYTGQEVGMNKRLEFFEKDVVPTWNINATFAFYQKLNELKHTHPALLAGKEGGEVKKINVTNKDVMFFLRAKSNQEVLVLLNLSGNEVSYSLSEPLSNANYSNYFTGERISEIPLSLKPWEYLILVK